MPLLESLSNTAKGLQAVRLATLLMTDRRTGALEPVVRRSATK